MRKIATDDILDAAERVAARSGAISLSIDAVAREAGISKSRVVYDYKSKSALLKALIDRYVEAEEARISAIVTEQAAAPHPELYGRLAAAAQTFGERDRVIALAISAASANEEPLRRSLHEWMARDFAALARGDRPRAALMAYLALSGLVALELFDFHQWTNEAERGGILNDIEKIYRSFPDT